MSLGKLFVNMPVDRGTAKLPDAYARQLSLLGEVWNEKTFGLERLMRLSLCLAQFLFPVLLLRGIFGRYGPLGRKLAVEIYTVLKLMFPLVVLWQGWFRHPPVVFLVVYFAADTFIHLLHLIFLSDLLSVAASYRRSLLLIFLHYAEIVFDFAVIYMAFDLLNRSMDAMTAVYFSLVATTTVGFGDICPKNAAGQAVVMAQLAVCVVFIVVFINYFSQKINEK